MSDPSLEQLVASCLPLDAGAAMSVRELRDALAVVLPEGHTPPGTEVVARLVWAVPGLRVDYRGGTVPYFSQLRSREPEAVRVASRGAWRSFVVGNTAYQWLGLLTKCVNDAEDMAEALASKGHVVTLVINAPRRQLVAGFNTFVSGLPAACTVVVFYSGHGCSVGRVNYLQLVDSRDTTPEEVEGEQPLRSGVEVHHDIAVSACVSVSGPLACSRVQCTHEHTRLLRTPLPGTSQPLNVLLERVYARVTSGALIVMLDACRVASNPMAEELLGTATSRSSE
jgi:hypothetical protein